MVEGNIWGGIPPVGKGKISNKWSFLFILLAVILFEWALWATYRYLTLPIIESAFTRLGFLFHILAAPIIGLTPILLYWKFVAREEGLPWRFTKKNLFTSITVGALSAALLMLAYQIANWFVLVISGQAEPTSAALISLWRSSITNGDLDWFILMTFTFFFIVGPVEELQYRSFLQDQIGRAFTPAVGLLLASAMFALSHLPIYILIYRLEPIQVMLTLCWTFTMGSVLGLFYFQSRNILGPIIMHGFWDWVLSIWVLDVKVKDSYFDLGYATDVLWLISLIPVSLLIIFFINIMYSSFWRDNRPDGSFGIGPIRILSNIADRIGVSIVKISPMKIFKGMDSSSLSLGTRVTRSILSVFIIALITMLLSSPGALIMNDNIGLERTGSPFDQEGISTLSFSQGLYVREGENVDVNIPLNRTWSIISIKVTIFWMDESPAGPRFTNLPDIFSSILEIDMEEADAQGPSESGSLIHSWESEEGNLTIREAKVLIKCESAGDETPIVDPIGLRRRPDDGNDITVSVQIGYFEPVFS